MNDFREYVLPEEELAWLSPSPASDIIQVVDDTVLRGLSQVISSFFDPGKRFFKEELCWEHYQSLKASVDALQHEHGERFTRMIKELGGKWQDILGYEYHNHNWDVLSSNICSLLCSNKEILMKIPEAVVIRIIEIASIGNSSWADKCCDQLGVTYIKGSVKVDYESYFSPRA